MEAVWVALIVAVVGLLGQWLLKRQDFKRQDEIAIRVSQLADQVAATSSTTDGKLEEVHVIVNQQRTDMQAYTALLKDTLARAEVPIPRDKSVQ